jgi:hypothetical protein
MTMFRKKQPEAALRVVIASMTRTAERMGHLKDAATSTLDAFEHSDARKVCASLKQMEAELQEVLKDLLESAQKAARMMGN